jgi:hypothetical protein
MFCGEVERLAVEAAAIEFEMRGSMGVGGVLY